MVDDNRLGIVRVSAAFLRQALRLPPETEIKDVRQDFTCPGVFELKLSNPDLEPVNEGKVIPVYAPRFHSDGSFDWGER